MDNCQSDERLLLIHELCDLHELAVASEFIEVLKWEYPGCVDVYVESLYLWFSIGDVTKAVEDARAIARLAKDSAADYFARFNIASRRQGASRHSHPRSSASDQSVLSAGVVCAGNSALPAAGVLCGRPRLEPGGGPEPPAWTGGFLCRAGKIQDWQLDRGDLGPVRLVAAAGDLRGRIRLPADGVLLR